MLVCNSTHSCTCARMSLGIRRPEVTIRCSPQLPPTSFFETGSLTEAWAEQLARLADQQSPGTLSSLPPTAREIGTQLLRPAQQPSCPLSSPSCLCMFSSMNISLGSKNDHRLSSNPLSCDIYLLEKLRSHGTSWWHPCGLLPCPLSPLCL